MSKITDKSEIYYHELIKKADTLSDFIKNVAWTEIVHPLWEKSIANVLGGKVGNTYYKGQIDKCKSDEKLAYYIGYKNALIDLYNNFHNIIEDGERARKALKKKKEQENQKKINPFEEAWQTKKK